MRQLTSKYDNDCTRCGNHLPIGAQVMYEKRTGIFCPGCEPTDVKDIRHFRQIKADARADRREQWAESRERKAREHWGKAEAATEGIPMGQPILVDHYSARRHRHALKVSDNHMRGAAEDWDKAKEHRAKADNIRCVQVKGDAERAREARREKAREWLTVGARVRDITYGTGTITRIHKKTARMLCDRDFWEVNVALQWLDPSDTPPPTPPAPPEPVCDISQADWDAKPSYYKTKRLGVPHLMRHGSLVPVRIVDVPA